MIKTLKGDCGISALRKNKNLALKGLICYNFVKIGKG
jgi:hypothetical protein